MFGLGNTNCSIEGQLSALCRAAFPKSIESLQVDRRHQWW